MKKQTLLFALLIFAGALSAQPTIWGGAKVKLHQGDTAYIATLGAIKSWLGLSGGGTVSSFSSGNLSPLFTTSVADPTTTPAQTFSLSNAAANTYFGNATGSTAAPSYTAAGALTKTDDTNVTLTLGGNASTALLRDASLTLGWTGTLASSRGGTGNGFTKFSGPTTSEKTFTLPNASATILTDNAAVTAAQGGTGQTSYTVGDILYASTTTALSKLADVATGNALISGGVGVAPSYGKIGLTTHISGVLPTANGGTNLNTLGGDNTFLASNGSAYYAATMAITHNDAAFSVARTSTTVNVNIPNATASLGGIVSTTTQTFAGNKTWGGTHTQTGLLTGNGGIIGDATSTTAALNFKGVEDADFRTVTTTSTIDETDFRVYVGTLTANITLNLPACNSTRDGWTYHFKKKNTGDSFAFILDPNSTETIDGAATQTYYGDGITTHCQCINGEGWYTVAR